MCDMQNFDWLVTGDDENVDIDECLEPQTPVLHDVCTVMHLVHQGDEGGRHLAGTHGAHVLYQIRIHLCTRVFVVKETAAAPD